MDFTARIQLSACFLAFALTGCVLDTKVGDNPDEDSTGSDTEQPGASTDEPGVTGPQINDTDSASGGATDDSATEPGSGGGPSDTEGVFPGVDPCIEIVTTLELAEQSPGGFSAEQLLADKLGPRASTLLFSKDPTTLSEQWKEKPFPVTVELRHEGGKIEWIDSEVNPEYEDEDEGIGPLEECNDRLRIEAELDFVTEGGEFDEHRTIVLFADSVELARGQVDIFEPPVDGTFDVTTLYSDPEWVSNGLFIGATWQGDKAGGELLSAVVVGGDGGFAGFGTVATWGDELF
jgi:hypothetical protein